MILTLEPYDTEHLTRIAEGAVQWLLVREFKRVAVQMNENGFELHPYTGGTSAWIRKIGLLELWNTKTKGIQIRSMSPLFAEGSEAYAFMADQIRRCEAEHYQKAANL